MKSTLLQEKRELLFIFFNLLWITTVVEIINKGDENINLASKSGSNLFEIISKFKFRTFQLILNSLAVGTYAKQARRCANDKMQNLCIPGSVYTIFSCKPNYYKFRAQLPNIHHYISFFLNAYKKPILNLWWPLLLRLQKEMFIVYALITVLSNFN